MAARDGDRTWIGSDTMASADGLKLDCGPKWVRFGAYAIGISGDLRTVSNCAKHAKRLMDDLAGAFDFTERLASVLQEYNFDLAPAPQAAPPNTAQDMILAHISTVWSLGPDLSIVECPEFWATGSGGKLALGAMSAMARIKQTTPEDLARIGIETAMQYDPSTGGDIWLEALE